MAYNNLPTNPGAFTEFTQKYGTDIVNLFGHFSDLTATKQYNEAIKRLNEFEKSKLDSEKFSDLKTKLTSVTPEMLPFDKEVVEGIIGFELNLNETDDKTEEAINLLKEKGYKIVKK